MKKQTFHKRQNISQTQIVLLLILIFQTGCFGLFAAEEASITLKTPSSRTVLYEDTARFVWSTSSGIDTVVHHYEVSFWSTARLFRKRYPSLPSGGRAEHVLLIPDVRTVFKKHGRYFWQVSAIDSQGYKTFSKIRTFFLPQPALSNLTSGWYSPNQVQFFWTNRVKHPGYAEFLKELNPATHMESYGEVSLFFRQTRPARIPLKLEERFSILSTVGFGADLSVQSVGYGSRFLSIAPEVRGGIAWFSTGIRRFDSILYDLTIGCSCAILPRSYVTLFAGWVPFYRIRYKKTGGDIRTFLGEGWEWGADIVIPHNVIPIFNIGGLEIDFEKIPIRVSMSAIRDEYTKVLMKNHLIGIGYRFR